jgi:hypothetical protein
MRGGRRVQLVPVVALALAVAASAGDPVPLGPEFRVDEEPPAYYVAPSRPDVAAGAAGNFVVTWWGADATTNYGAFARPFDHAGTPLAGDLLLSSPPNAAFYPSVAADADGDFVVVWNDDPDAVAGYFIKGRRVSAVGVVQGTEFTVSSVSYYEYEPRAASAPAGEFVVVWDDFEYGPYPNQFTIQGRRYDADGMAVDVAFPIEPDGTSRQVGPQIGMDADGDFVVVWLDYQPFLTPSVIRAQRHDATNTPVGGQFVVTTDAYSSYSNDGRLPAVAMNDGGAFVVVWETESLQRCPRLALSPTRKAPCPPRAAERRVRT